MAEDWLPARILEKITGLKRSTFRAWVSDGLLHPTKRKWLGKNENLYDLDEVRSVLVEKRLTSELAKLDAYREKQAVEASTGKYTTSVNFELINGMVARARRFLPSPAGPATAIPAKLTPSLPVEPMITSPATARMATIPARPLATIPVRPPAAARSRPTSAIPAGQPPAAVPTHRARASKQMALWKLALIGVTSWLLGCCGLIWLLSLIAHR